MRIAVIGSGYVGTTLAALLAASGHVVSAIDINQARVDKINSGEAPFYEDGLNRLVATGIESGKLKASSSYDSVMQSEVVFSCVGTPDLPDGSSDLSFVESVAKTCSELMTKNSVFVQKSTVPVGTGKLLSKLLPDDVSYISNPEFLREGTAIEDSINFDRVVVGGDNKHAVSKIESLYREITLNAKAIIDVTNLNIDIKPTGEFISTNLESAELIKVTSNAFLALKISFANSIAKVCDKSGADVSQVMNGVGSDGRIGKAFLNAGRGYGGGCFPKDVSGLINSSLALGVNMPIMLAATEVNDSMPEYIINKLKTQLDLKGARIVVLGLAFKKGTSDTRKSPGIKIARELSRRGSIVSAYDPEAVIENDVDLPSSVSVETSLKRALKQVGVVIIATDWPEFCSHEWLASLEPNSYIVDGVNCLNKQSVIEHGHIYIGVGR